MRHFMYLALLICALAVASCVSLPSLPPTPAPAPGATQEAATQVPAVTTAPLATSVVATAPAVPTAAAAPTLAPAVQSPVPTLPPIKTTPVAAPTAAGVVAFTSARLGISFDYLPENNGQQFGVLEQGDKVYVYAANTQPTTGQYVQVFRKAAAQSLADAIKAQVLAGYSQQDCIVSVGPSPEPGATWPPTYVFARIDVPRTANDDLGTLSAKAQKCPQPYAAVGGLAYFVADTQHLDRFAFFSIGQYAILAGANRPWQTTLRFLDTSAGGGAPPPAAPVTSAPTAAVVAPYLDDRSSAASLLASYVNAINHREYARAYSYWNVAAGQQNGLADFPHFSQGYVETQSVQLTVGNVTTDVGAGQIYYWTPVTLVARTTGGATQTFVGCYKLHLARPSIQAVPPFMPLAIESANVRQVDNGANTHGLMATACEAGGQPLPAEPAWAPGDISPARYLDDRSDGVQVLRSLFNAINRQEYVRAYSYWEPGSAQRPAFNAFQAGYANTATVELATGPSAPGAAAGNLYYQVPVVLVATHTDGSKQTFAGCYTLHMANPGMQTDPPYHTLGIQSATIRQVANNADTQPLLQGACSQ